MPSGSVNDETLNASHMPHDPKGFCKAPGWSSPEDGLAHIIMTHAFFR